MISGYLGPSASSVLSDKHFLHTWEALFQQCSWATVFQSHRYVLCWYELYKTTYTPLIVVEKSGDRVSGIFPLAISPDGEIVVAGHHQAEYQAWISADEQRATFFIDAVRWIRAQYPGKKISLKYLPHSLRVDDLMNHHYLKNISFWKAYPQPVIRVNEEVLNAELKKKNRKEKINRLNRMGVLKFERINSLSEFQNSLDGLIEQYDFRQGALYGTEFFVLDKLKRDFMIRLFQDDLLHVTFLKLDDEIIASNAGVHGRGVVYLQGFNTHMPTYSKYSPGILSFLMVGVQMCKEGFEEFDLTPGELEGYKADLATHFYEAHELVISNFVEVAKRKLITSLKSTIKKNLSDDRKDKWQRLANKIKATVKGTKSPGSLTSAASQPGTMIHEPHEGALQFSIKKGNIDFSKKNSAAWIEKNSLKHLLFFQDHPSGLSKQEFLFDAMKRLEFGQHVFTLAEGSKLIACLWHIPIGAKVDYPTISKAESSSVFLLVYSAGNYDLRGLVTESIKRIFTEEKELEVLVVRVNQEGPSVDSLIDSAVITYTVG